MKKYWDKEKIAFLKETRDLLTGEAYKQFCERFSDATSYTAFSVKKSKENCCNAEVKKLKWKKEWLSFIETTRGMTTEEAWESFIALYGEVVTKVAFTNQRSRSGASAKKPHKSNKRMPLYSETKAKKYTMIKIAEPNKWISKSRWIWEQNHPGEEIKKGDQFFHLNGNKEDYTPENLIKIESRVRTLFIQEGGVNENPEVTKINLLKARLKLAQLDAGEKIGMVVQTTGGRRWKKN